AIFTAESLLPERVADARFQNLLLNFRGGVMEFNRIKKGVVALACLPLMIAAGAANAGSWASTHTDAFSTEALKSVGKVADSQSMHVVVSLKLRNESELDGVVARIMNPRDSMFHQALSHEDVSQKYMPTREQAEAVAQHLRDNGFTHIEVASN